MRAIIFILLCLICLSGCRTSREAYKEVLPVPVKEYVYKDRDVLRVDTILQKDSVYVRLKGDTLLIEKFRTVYKVQKDSIRQRDTVYIEKPVTIKEKEVVTKESLIPFWAYLLLGGLIGILIYRKF